MNVWIGKLYFRELRITIARDGFFETVFRWSFQVKFVFSVSPRKLKLWTLSAVILLRGVVGLGFF